MNEKKLHAKWAIKYLFIFTFGVGIWSESKKKEKENQLINLMTYFYGSMYAFLHKTRWMNERELESRASGRQQALVVPFHFYGGIAWIKNQWSIGGSTSLSCVRVRIFISFSHHFSLLPFFPHRISSLPLSSSSPFASFFFSPLLTEKNES